MSRRITNFTNHKRCITMPNLSGLTYAENYDTFPRRGDKMGKNWGDYSREERERCSLEELNTLWDGETAYVENCKNLRVSGEEKMSIMFEHIEILDEIGREFERRGVDPNNFIEIETEAGRAAMNGRER